MHAYIYIYQYRHQIYVNGYIKSRKLIVAVTGTFLIYIPQRKYFARNKAGLK